MIFKFRSSHAHALALILGLAAAGCDDGKHRGAAELADDTGPEEAVPIAVDCSFVFANNQIDVTYESSGMSVETAVGGKLIASGVLSDDEFEGRTFSLSVYAEDSSVLSSALYQMDRTRLPYNEFYGNHGFTGLHSVRDPDAQETVQFACFARDPGDSPQFWED
ncbi:MAG TPA: hypothetical protein VM869_06185 [Enhygromyxa sp.]|nr:hypothetical protein [Enhygromyxa sp.]